MPAFFHCRNVLELRDAVGVEAGRADGHVDIRLRGLVM